VIHFQNLDRLGVETVALVRSAVPAARIVLTLHDYQLICANDGLMLTTHENARCSEASADRCHRCFPQIAAERFALRQKWLASHLSLIDAFIAPTRYVRDRYIAWGVDPCRIYRIPNASAVGEPTDAPAAENLSAGRRNRFAFFGAIAPHKGVLTLLDAAARLSATKTDVTVALQGGLGHADDAWRRRFFEALDRAWPVASYAGPYPRDEVVGLMRQADWIVVPSLWWEAAPLVVAEAFHAGRPVICSGAGALAEMVRDGIDGLHTPPGDAGALATMLARVSADPRLWERMRANVRPTSGIDQFVAQHLRLYDALVRKDAA
jgi:glycosyltransferase involved in cell wall biosynthesis